VTGPIAAAAEREAIHPEHFHRARIGPRHDQPRPDAASVVVVEDVAQLAREGLGLAGVAELAPEEATVVAREHDGLLAEQFGGG